MNKTIEWPTSQKIAALLKHDSTCAQERGGPCTCEFYDTAERLIRLFEQVAKASREEEVARIKRGLEWETGTVYYTNPSDGKKYQVYNKEHVDRLLTQDQIKE